MRQSSRKEFRGEILQTRRVQNLSLISVAYSPNQVLARHSHENAYVSVTLRGCYLEQRPLRSWECAVGGTIFHEPGECHQNRFFESGARLLVLEIHPSFLTDISDRGIRTDRQCALTSPECMHLAMRLDHCLELSDPLSGLCAEGLSLELISQALRPGLDARTRSSPDWLPRVHEILHDRYREHLTLTQIAGEVQVHPVHLARAFRKRYQCCIGDFIRKLRVEAACYELLKSDAPIAEIAARTGFTDQSHLSRILKRHAGISPGQFRKSRSTV